MTIATLEQLQGKRKQKRAKASNTLLRLFEDLSYLPEELAHEVRLLRKVVPEDASDESVLQFRVHDNDCVLLAFALLKAIVR